MLIPKDNEKDLAEIPDNVKRGMEIIPVSTVDDILDHALVSPLTPIEWDEEVEAAAVANASSDDDDLGGVVTH